MNVDKRIKYLHWLFFLIGFVFCIVGLYMFTSMNRVKDIGVEVEAVIADIVSDSNVYVKYTYDGVDYHNRLSYYSSSMYEGADIVIYIDPENPRDILSSPKLDLLLCIIFSGVGSVMLIVDIGLMIKAIKKAKRYENLLNTGTRYEAEIVSVDINTYFSLNNVHPLFILCQAEINDEIHNFRSDDSFRLGNLVEDKHIVNVYVNPNDMNDYYVDIREFEY